MASVLEEWTRDFSDARVGPGGSGPLGGTAPPRSAPARGVAGLGAPARSVKPAGDQGSAGVRLGKPRQISRATSEARTIARLALTKEASAFQGDCACSSHETHASLAAAARRARRGAGHRLLCT